MAEEVKVLKKALAEFRSGRQTRARVDSLDNAMQTVRRAFPAAFDPANEKINDEEEEAMSLYRQCKGALQSSVSTQATRKRGRGAASSEAKSETECEMLSIDMIAPFIDAPFIDLGPLFARRSPELQ